SIRRPRRCARDPAAGRGAGGEGEAAGRGREGRRPPVGDDRLHGDIIKSIIAAALGMPLDEFQRLSVAPGSFTVIDYSGARPVLAAMSVTAAGLAQSSTVGGGGLR